MRLVIFVPDLIDATPLVRVMHWWQQRPHRFHNPLLRAALGHPYFRTHVVWGGTLNIMRHGLLARQAGFEVVMATPSGRDTYGDTWGIVDLPYIRWSDRRPDDLCLVPDFASDQIDLVEGPVIAYMQVPTHMRQDFDWHAERVTMWTDSPFMLDLCHQRYPGKEVSIVPNIIDQQEFPFVPQSQREAGLAFAFPRKGPEFIAQTRRLYREQGGRYWHFELIDGLPLRELAREFSRPQLFLASGEIEGCALPPQESMASGVVVVGKNARGANFGMRHRETAMVANSPEQAAQCLREAEDPQLREHIAQTAYAMISRYFPDNEPAAFWRDNVRSFSA